MKNLIPIAFCIIAIASCKQDTSKTIEPSTAPTIEAAAEKYTLTPFSPSTEYADATITSMDYTAGTFNFGVADYELGLQTPDAGQKMCANSGKGQHIHLIVDNAPYAAKYESTFDYEIEDGEHYLVAFLSRSYHESIKTKGANVIKKVVVKDNSLQSAVDVSDPMVFYSRPKGTYVGDDTNKVMLDFYLANVDLNKMSIKASINGEVHMIDQWQPYYIEGLEMGENEITLSLVDKAGQMVTSDLLPVTRAFTLMPDPTPEK